MAKIDLCSKCGHPLTPVEPVQAMLRKDIFEDWPVLDEEPGEGITLWLELDEDFLGERNPLKFPYLPTMMGQVVSATNVPLTLVCQRNREGRWRRRRSEWLVRSSSLWSERKGGFLVAGGHARGWGFSLVKGDCLTITDYTLVGVLR